MTKLWEKGVGFDKKIESFTVGNDNDLDQILLPYDCEASIAHVKMLNKMKYLNDNESDKLIKELNFILEESKSGNFKIKKSHEDCHTAIEDHLVNTCGDSGKKIHTARSRNDQVLTALRLYYRESIDDVKKLLIDLIKSLELFSDKNGKIQFPGYTHMQKAMPSSVQLWSNAYIESMNDDLKLLQTAYALINQSPLGSGAGFGVPINIDRKFLAKELKFDSVQDNPIYCQLSRGKFELYIINIFTQIMFSINRIASDIVLFCTDEFKFFSLPDEFCSGSSIMPNKRNPDVLELLRGSYSILIGYQSQIQSLSQNLISGYNRDIQLSKEPTMRSFDLIKNCLDINTLVISGLIVNEENCKKAMTDELFATEQAYNMVKEGIPFRQAYRKIADELIKK
tara:strand:- start:2504 stop:3691 length:1188 start_codon:yes stop_codon:yes gene_type:complete